MFLQENTVADLMFKITRNVIQDPLHHVIYAGIKFEVTTLSDLGGVTFTINVMDGRTTARLWYEINIPFFGKKAGIITIVLCCPLSKGK